MNCIFERRSYRKFTDKDVEDAVIEKLLRAGMQAPSACDQRPWEFIVIKNKNILNDLAEATPYSMCVKNSLVAIVPCYRKKDIKIEEYIICDMSACVENILLEATYLGVGGVWIGGSPNEDRINKIKEIVKISEELTPFCIIPIGYPIIRKEFEDRYDETRVHYIR